MSWTQTVNCPCCGKEAHLANTFVGEQAKATGFEPVFTHEGSIMWVCGTCAAEVGRRVAAVIALFPEAQQKILTYCYWPALMKLAKKIEKDPKEDSRLTEKITIEEKETA